MIRKKSILFLVLLPIVGFGQKTEDNDNNLIFWSSARKLKASDFNIIRSEHTGQYIRGYITYDYSNLITTFSFGLVKNYKSKVRNYFIKNASWIDTTQDVTYNLLYQQTSWDLLEVYVRQFRKSIYENRKHLKTQEDYNKINNEIIAAFSKQQAEYETSTAFATITEKQKEWEIVIAKELQDLKDYATE